MNYEEYSKELEISKIDSEFYPCIKFAADCLDSVDDVANPLMVSIYFAKGKVELTRLYLALRSSTSLWIRDEPSFFIKVEKLGGKWPGDPKHICGHCIVTNSQTDMVNNITILGRISTGNKRRSVICKPCATFFPLLQTFLNRYYEQGRALPMFRKSQLDPKILYTDYD